MALVSADKEARRLGFVIQTNGHMQNVKMNKIYIYCDRLEIEDTDYFRNVRIYQMKMLKKNLALNTHYGFLAFTVKRLRLVSHYGGKSSVL